MSSPGAIWVEMLDRLKTTRSSGVWSLGLLGLLRYLSRTFLILSRSCDSGDFSMILWGERGRLCSALILFMYVKKDSPLSPVSILFSFECLVELMLSGKAGSDIRGGAFDWQGWQGFRVCGALLLLSSGSSGGGGKLGWRVVGLEGCGEGCR